MNPTNSELADELEQLPVVKSADGEHDLFWLDVALRDRILAALSNLTPSPAVDLLREAREILSDAAEVPLADPYILIELRALCERVGYGNVMKSASALWRERLGEQAGGEFVCSPCRSTVANLLVRIDAALKEAK